LLLGPARQPALVLLGDGWRDSVRPISREYDVIVYTDAPGSLRIRLWSVNADTSA
jgi:hypothetical protein